MKGTQKGPNDVPISRWRPRPGESRGPEWVKRPQLGLLIDTWYWKTFFTGRVCAQPGDPGSFTWFGREADQRRADHTQLLSHLSSEYSKQESGERTVNRYEQKPGMENHHYDSTLLCAEGASVCGISLAEPRKLPGSNAPVTLEELKRRAKLK